MAYFDPGYFAFGATSESDYFECDDFDPTYFDTPDCGGGEVAAGSHRVARRRLPPPVDEADEFLAII